MHKDESSYPCIHHLFEAQVEKAPQTVALVHQEEVLTYQALNERANQCARYLQSVGVGPETLVAVCIERSLDMVIALLGVLKSGGAYLCLDSRDPMERLAFMLDDAQVSVLLTQERLRDGLPNGIWNAIDIDSAREVMAQQSSANLSIDVTPDNLAYVTYTSGSMGQPKGTQIPHCSVGGYMFGIDYARFDSEQTFLHYSSTSWDVLTLELWTALLNGAKCILHSEGVPTPAELKKEIDTFGVTTLWLTSSLFNTVIDLMPEALANVRQLLIGGEELSAAHVRRALQLLPSTVIVNGYGPSECTVFTSCYVIPRTLGEQVRALPIGRPAGDRKVYLLDPMFQPVPSGAPGELCVGGPSVARGYLNQPMMTAEKFIPSPLGDGKGARLYRTGDHARRLADGNLEFLGRVDNQIKLRGFRIELGEITAVLSQHPAVSHAVAVVREDVPGDKRVVAYIVPRPAQESRPKGGQEESAAEQIDDWQDVFENTYLEGTDAPDPLTNFIGWNSSYTGLPIPEAEMREWWQGTLERLQALGPQRVLEIGCGTGLLLLHLAPACDFYYATDFSKVALEYVDKQLNRLRRNGVALPPIMLEQRQANVFTGLEAGSFDTVILNSVIQYFPQAEYLMEVLEGALRVVKPGGRVFVGDVRNHALLEAFYTSVELFSAPASESAEQLWMRVKNRVMQEKELTVAPAFFQALANQFDNVEVELLLKRGNYGNELNRFRYDAILHVGTERTEQPQWANWEAGQDVAQSLQRVHEAGAAERLAIRNIPNARLTESLKAVELLTRQRPPKTVGDLRKELGRAVNGAVDPAEFWALAERMGWSVEVGWSDPAASGTYAAVFKRRAAGDQPSDRAAVFVEPRPVSSPLKNLTSDPMAAAALRQLVPEVRNFLKERLPDYMLPSSLVILQELPLTKSGKLDRKRLPQPDQAQQERASQYQGPRNPEEEALVKIWSEVLGIEKIGVRDSFFELGGHSLLATQVVSRVRQAFAVDLPLRTLFDAPTVATLCQHIHKLKTETQDLRKPIMISPAGLNDHLLEKLLTELEQLPEE